MQNDLDQVRNLLDMPDMGLAELDLELGAQEVFMPKKVRETVPNHSLRVEKSFPIP
jgi:hypothetical protein